jgi:FAD/FMN-containing dehydrogenase
LRSDSDVPSIFSNEVLSEEKAKTMFGENHVRLQELKKRYDPGLVFNKWYAIKPSGPS